MHRPRFNHFVFHSEANLWTSYQLRVKAAE